MAEIMYLSSLDLTEVYYYLKVNPFQSGVVTSADSFYQSLEEYYSKGCTEAVCLYPSQCEHFTKGTDPQFLTRYLVSSVDHLLQYCSLVLQITLWAQTETHELNQMD